MTAMISPEVLATVKGWRRHLHAHPELSGQEAETARYIAARLTGMGVAHETGIGGHGIVARLHRPGSDRSVGLRADFDALPIAEAGNAPYRSMNPGVMHACGHDGHTAALLGAASVLSADEDWQGTIHLIFQPAEENGQGAKAMIADGLFDRYRTERIFGWHNIPGWDAGTLSVHRGPSMAAGGDWHVVYRGVAGHAAQPHLTRDPVTAMGHLIVALNSIVSRNVDPAETVVITASMVQGGTVSNQIPETCELTGTLRSFDEDLRRDVIARMEDVIEGTARAFGVPPEYRIASTGRVINNTPPERDLAVAAGEALGLPIDREIEPFMGGDDFAFLIADRPGAYIFIGNGPVVGQAGLHNAGYDFNDAILDPAISWLSEVARMALMEAA